MYVHDLTRKPGKAPLIIGPFECDEHYEAWKGIVEERKNCRFDGAIVIEPGQYLARHTRG